MRINMLINVVGRAGCHRDGTGFHLHFLLCAR